MVKIFTGAFSGLKRLSRSSSESLELSSLPSVITTIAWIWPGFFFARASMVSYAAATAS